MIKLGITTETVIFKRYMLEWYSTELVKVILLATAGEIGLTTVTISGEQTWLLHTLV